MLRTPVYSAVVALLTAASAQAATLTLAIDSGVQFYNETRRIQAPPPPNPVAGNLTGTLVYDTLLFQIVSADLIVSGLPGSLGSFNKVYNVLPGRNDQIFAAGTSDHTDEEFINFRFHPNLSTLNSVGQTAVLTRPALSSGRVYSNMSICNAGDAAGCTSGRSQALFDGAVTVTDIAPAPIPLPAGLPLLAAALGVLVVVRRRRD